MGTMNLTLETKPTAAGGWLAYCEWARVILRGSPVEVLLVPNDKDPIKHKPTDKLYSTRRD